MSPLLRDIKVIVLEPHVVTGNRHVYQGTLPSGCRMKEASHGNRSKETAEAARAPRRQAKIQTAPAGATEAGRACRAVGGRSQVSHPTLVRYHRSVDAGFGLGVPESGASQRLGCFRR